MYRRRRRPFHSVAEHVGGWTGLAQFGDGVRKLRNICARSLFIPRNVFFSVLFTYFNVSTRREE